MWFSNSMQFRFALYGTTFFRESVGVPLQDIPNSKTIIFVCTPELSLLKVGINSEGVPG